MHKIPDCLINPSHQVTVALIGCGGTGSHAIGHLGAIDTCLKTLGHPGIMVYAYDPDLITEANKGRQRFSGADIGLNKAITLISRINRIQGSSWEGIPEYFTKDTHVPCNIYLSCVDNVKSRITISKIIKDKRDNHHFEPYKKPYYWMDFGNLKDTGQVIIGTLSKIEQPKSKKYRFIEKLPIITEMFDLTQIDEKDTGPSCSAMEALTKQNLFINPSLATLGCDLLWQMLSTGMTDKAGLFLNLKSMNVNPINI
ncbi:PRTRC system ThiF family protein [Dysgonomonas sp. PF1-16]|uniref:PRTRC system ThiF family protein n=2 Tax=Dysgonomonas TaxID=156973 RepID=UPI002475FDE5|nr:PRTRC system ThiF family protein [Dysgonomonas sp. PF1-16]